MEKITGIIEITGRIIRIARIKNEWYEDVSNPDQFIIKNNLNQKADIFTFWQRLPENRDRNTIIIANGTMWQAIPVTNYDHWFTRQIDRKTRNILKKSQKLGVVVRKVPFSDKFVRDVERIFNESPMRQNQVFLHFGKSFELIKREFEEKFVNRSDFLGAFYHDELIGFITFTNTEHYAIIDQILSKLQYRDTSSTNALICRCRKIM